MNARARIKGLERWRPRLVVRSGAVLALFIALTAFSARSSDTLLSFGGSPWRVAQGRIRMVVTPDEKTRDGRCYQFGPVVLLCFNGSPTNDVPMVRAVRAR